MMDFKEFTQRAEQDIRAALEDASPGTRVDVNQVEKLQGESYTAVTLTPDATNMGMNLNLNQLYDRMQGGDSYEHVIRGALDQAKEQLGHMPRFNVSEISSYETAKELLFVDVVGTRVNLIICFNTETEVSSLFFNYLIKSIINFNPAKDQC